MIIKKLKCWWASVSAWKHKREPVCQRNADNAFSAFNEHIFTFYDQSLVFLCLHPLRVEFISEKSWNSSNLTSRNRDCILIHQSQLMPQRFLKKHNKLKRSWTPGCSWTSLKDQKYSINFPRQTIPLSFPRFDFSYKTGFQDKRRAEVQHVDETKTDFHGKGGSCSFVSMVPELLHKWVQISEKMLIFVRRRKNHLLAVWLRYKTTRTKWSHIICFKAVSWLLGVCFSSWLHWGVSASRYDIAHYCRWFPNGCYGLLNSR